MKSQTKRWSDNDTKQLYLLFQSEEANPDCNKKSIEAAHGKYFSSFNIKNFTATYRRKAQQFLLDRTLQGARSNTQGKGKAWYQLHDKNFNCATNYRVYLTFF